MGEIKFEGMTVFKEECVRPLFKLETGRRLQGVAHQEGLRQAARRLRQPRATSSGRGGTERKPDPERKVVDVTLIMEEDKRYYVGRIHFTGNDTTRDKVIRREVYLNEGDVFNTEALKLSIRRINQLGYFKPMEGPPEPAARATWARTSSTSRFKVEEQNRNQFTFGGGVSGLEGTFINASFSTANFLGAGETFQLSAQSGRRTKNYQLAVTEPYLFDRPITAGFDVFKPQDHATRPSSNVVGYTQESQGRQPDRAACRWAASRASSPTTRTRSSTSRAWTRPRRATRDDAPIPDRPARLRPLLLRRGRASAGRAGSRRRSSTTRSTTPTRPRSGMKHHHHLRSSPAGRWAGTVNYFKPDAGGASSTSRTRGGRRWACAAEAAYIMPYGDTAGAALYQRFFLGGETQIRGYNIRTVGPWTRPNRRPGRQQVRAVQRRVLLRHRRARCASCSSSTPARPSWRTSTSTSSSSARPPARAALHHARAQRAVPPDLRLEPAAATASSRRSTFKFAVGTTF